MNHPTSSEDNINALAAKLYAELQTILMRHCGERGDNEGVIETLDRIVKERDILLRNAIKSDLLKLK